MFCPKCAVNIERALTRLDGVVAAQVNYATERATVVYDPTRVPAIMIVNALRSMGFDTPLERVTLHADALLYATSAQTLERALGRAEGVVQVSADLGARRLALQVFPERASSSYLEHLLAGLGFRAVESASPDAGLEFVIRGLIVAALAFVLVWGAVNHSGIFAPVSGLPSLILLAAFTALALFGASWPFYRRAYAAGVQGELDASVLIALVASATFVCGTMLALTSRVRGLEWTAWGGFIVATLLTAGWFLARALTLWVFPRFRHATRRGNRVTPAPQTQLGIISDGSRR
jgi:Cu+-exporting ATPase